MHRSGTSLAASFFEKCGVNMGETKLGPTPHNAPGRFEDVDFLRFQARIIERVGNSLAPIAPSMVSATEIEEAKALIKRREHLTAWGWKEPRTTLFLEFWHQLLPSATFLFMVRHPFEVVASLRRRDDEGKWWWKGDTIKLRRWLLYTGECLKFHEKNSQHSMVVTLKDFIQHSDKVLHQVEALLGTTLERPEFDKLYNPRLLTSRGTHLKTFALPREYFRSLKMYSSACELSKKATT